MAQAISSIASVDVRSSNEEEKRLEKLAEAAVSQADGLEQAIELVGALHKMGILTALLAMLDKAPEMLNIAMRQVDSPGSVGGLKNFLTLTQTFASIDLEGVPTLLQGFAAGVRKAAESNENVPITGAWDMLKLLRDPDVSRGLSAIFTLLKGLGEALRNDDDAAASHAAPTQV